MTPQSVINTPKHASRFDQGFTLIEVLSVLVIIGLMSSVVILTLPKPAPAYDQLSGMISQNLRAARQQSILSGEPTAIGLSNQSYGVMVYQNGVWQVRSDTPWPRNVSVRFAKDDNAVNLSDEVLPLIMFSPTGTMTPFSMTFSGTNSGQTLTGSANGKVHTSSRHDGPA